jgi:hypothetical protein
LRKPHVLLRMLPLRAVVNQLHLYPLQEREPVVISFADPVARLFVTNGFHASAITELHFEPGSAYFFHVEAVAGNRAIWAMLIVAIVCFISYAITGQGFLLLLANLPVVVLIALFFIFPSRSIVLKPWQPAQSTTTMV